MTDNSNPKLPLMEDMRTAMTDTGIRILEPHALGMLPGQVTATFVIAAISAAWAEHWAYSKQMGHTKTAARLRFLKTCKIIVKDIPEEPEEEG